MGLFSAKYTPDFAANQCIKIAFGHYYYVCEQVGIERIGMERHANGLSIYLRMVCAIALRAASDNFSKEDANIYGNEFVGHMEEILSSKFLLPDKRFGDAGPLLKYLDQSWYEEVSSSINVLRTDSDVQELAQKTADQIVRVIPYKPADTDKFDMTVSLFCRTQAMKLFEEVSKTKYSL